MKNKVFGFALFGGGVQYTCPVYTLTAKFEADISTLWPTSKNLLTVVESYPYISMSSDKESYYWNVVALTSQKNILNVYSTMDRNVLAMGNDSS